MNKFVIIGSIFKIKDTTLKLKCENEIIDFNLPDKFIKYIPILEEQMIVGIQFTIKSGNKLNVEKLTCLKSSKGENK